MSVQLEEISRKGGRGHENGTLGNVQGNHLREFREEGLGRPGGRVYGGKPEPSTLSTLYPNPLSTKKPSMDPGKTLTMLGFLDIFYFTWTFYIFLRRDLLAVYI